MFSGYFNTNTIAYDNGPSPIKYSTDHNQPYFTMFIQNDVEATFYINHSDHLIPGVACYDFYGSGEIYVNLNFPYVDTSTDSSFYISGVSSIFNPLYRTIAENPSIFLSTDNPPNSYSTFDFSTLSNYDNHDSSSAGLAVLSNFRDPSSSPCFYFKIPAVFSVDPLENNSNSVSTVFPICEYYTHDDQVSPHYKFANYPSACMGACSHPIISSSESITPCRFPSSSQRSCIVFTPLRKFLSKVDVVSFNSSSSVSFSLYENIVFQNDDSYTRNFDIINEQTKDVVHNFSVPSLDSSGNIISKEQAETQVENIFQEFLSTYDDSEISQSPKEQKPSISFINTLLGS